MKKVWPVWLCMLLILVSCNPPHAPFTDNQTMPLGTAKVISIDNGSTPVTIETISDLDSLEVSSTAPDRKPAFTIERSQQHIRIAANNHLFRIFNLANKPVMVVKIPLHYKGSLQINSSSGSVNIIRPQNSLVVDGTSGSIELTADRIVSDIRLASTSGKISLRIAEPVPDVSWTLESRSGRRSFALEWRQMNENKHISQGVTGQGTHQIHVITRSGNIQVQ
ncbi:DUF4097 domain-containing protein [Paenibacillus polysaccharolyticus]|uniref:DUF4097 family beta strand repeat protein n=1 Tax=Paenibacillus cucumis (ex Kampfer et al. 2016) TaxID=1776858 RepID=A0ABS7KER0_9BACL|nr:MULTISPECIES: DUF4097 family beta strand repeat-containing protein [Paenibacillus]MBY0202624.1 DUF4097 family beta strand repeat protein [Paenibacillus cucumis (ex Kampfer et al. 2016)]MCM3135013.1 DUF4097 domain-containing protein [Paenibacillus polysaccharolyticus]MCP1136541.1 DUF4097 domain-containing protein [Paenibacillus polysaccharolyticus]